MMTVRFPTGVAVQFNEANYVIRGDRITDLYDKKDGRWLAQVPNDCLIEVVRACRVYNSNHEPGAIVDALNRMVADPARREALPRYELAELKRRLRAFDSKGKVWK